MAQAIETRYLGPTNSRGARVKASCEAGSVTVPWDHALDSIANHDAAARALIFKLGWDGDALPSDGRWHRGGRRGAGYVYVLASYRLATELKGARPWSRSRHVGA